MDSVIVGLLAETSIHPGAGQETGFVDLPVAREAATDYPVIVGSSMKGALLERARAAGLAQDALDEVFGRQESAGALLVGDARLVLLPVRSLTSQYKWVTCAHLQERLRRDRMRVGGPPAAAALEGPEKGRYLGAGDGDLYLEERQFRRAGQVPAGLVESLSSLVAHAETARRLADRVVVLHDDDFAWFARYGLAINARNVLADKTKTSKNLWYEETIPPDSLFYCLLAERQPGAVAAVMRLFAEQAYLRVGGNETVGQGWMAVRAGGETAAGGDTQG